MEILNNVVIILLSFNLFLKNLDVSFFLVLGLILGKKTVLDQVLCG